jgi:ABC-type transport system involved in multi-copper enzyme maturation permease subunit
MKKLMIDFTSRLIKGKAFWISVILSVVPVLYSFLEPLSKGTGESLAEHFLEWSTLSVICAFIPVCAYTTAALFSHNTIQDIISKGYSQREIYFAKTLVNVIFSTAVIASSLTITGALNIITSGLSRITGTVYDDVNFLSFFSTSFFETSYFMDNVNAYILPVSGIYLVLTIIVYIIGVQGFSNAQLKLIKE